MQIHKNRAFAPLDRNNDLERIAGGNETEVYRTDDWRFVVKMKGELGGPLDQTLAEAKVMRAAAETFAECLGDRHTVPNYYLISRDDAGDAHVIVVQPLVRGRTLHNIDYGKLKKRTRKVVAKDLRRIIKRSLRFYRERGSMPDLYGRTSSSSAERQRMKSWRMLPKRLWSFLVERNLLRANNLMLTDDDDQPRIVLVDYDYVRRGNVYKFIYFLVRRILFVRDRFLIGVMKRGGPVPGDD